MRLFFIALLLSCALPQAHADFSDAPQVPKLLASLRNRDGFTGSQIKQVKAALRQARLLPQLIHQEAHPKERTLTWAQYAPIHVNQANINNGLAFMQQERRWLTRANKLYGVSPAVVTAILGVESKYGRYTGNVPVLDALATMAFDYHARAPFFMSELEQFFVLCRDDHLDPAQPKGSYAGAMGDAQLMPSSVLRMGVDFNHNGRVNPWSPPDAIGSVANYLAHFDPHLGWQSGMPLLVHATVDGPLPANVAVNATHPTTTVGALRRAGVTISIPLAGKLKAGVVEIVDGHRRQDWIALNNFFSVLSYNSHLFYAMAVAQLAQALANPHVAGSDPGTGHGQ